MLTLTTLFICGAWAGVILPNSHFIFIALIFILAVLIKLTRFKASIKNIPFLFLSAAVIMLSTGLFRANYVRTQNLSAVVPFAHEQVTVYGEVLAVDSRETVTIVELKAYRLEHNNDLHKLDTKINLIIYGTAFDASIRDIIVSNGYLQLYEPMKFWGDSGSRSYYASKGVFAKVTASGFATEVIGRSKRTIDLLAWGENGRKYIKETVDKYLSGDEGALMKGILIGDKQDFSPELKEAFRLSGMSHIVAVSGLHVGLFIVFISFGTWRFLSNRKWRATLLLFAIFSYTVIIGAQPSILRAALMAGYGITLENLKLRRDSHTALMFVTAFLAFINPYLLHNTGFQLSFLATLGIVLLNGRIFKYKVANAGVAAFLFISPLLAYSFNTVTFASLITNILVSPLVIISLLLGYVMCLIPYSGVVLSPVIFCTTHVMILISKFFASLKFLTLDIASPSFLVLVSWFIGLYIFYQCITGNRKRMRTLFAASATTALLIVNIFSFISSANDIRVNFIAMQSGDGVHIRTPKGYNLLIDAGNESDIAGFLQKKNIHMLDAVILTNLKTEDTNGVQYLLSLIPVKRIFLPYNDGIFNTELADEKKTDLKYFRQGERITIDSISFDILKHDPYADTLSNSSAAVKMTGYGTGILFLGDFSKEYEHEMIKSHQRETLKSDILRLANNGAPSSTSNSFELIKAADAKYAIANAGYNSKEKLSEEVYINLLRNKTKPLKTYEYGTIGFTINKNGIKQMKRTRIPLEEDL